MNRRGFFGRLGVMAAAPMLAARSNTAPAVARSDKGVPPCVDCRENRDATYLPIIVKRYGERVNPVAYDLNADTVTLYRKDPNGMPLYVDGVWEYETLHGGVSVHWDQKRLEEEREHRRKFRKVAGIFALVLALPFTASAQAPVVSFVYQCSTTVPQCSFDGSQSTGAVSYTWVWGDGRTETHTRATAANTWPVANVYDVQLIVKNAAGATSAMMQKVQIPAAPPPSPTKPDTVRIVRVDTVTLPGRVDTVTVNTGAPIFPGSLTIDDPNGDRLIHWNNQMLGRLILRVDGQVEAVRYNPAVLFGQMGMKVQGVYPTQWQAILALMQPPPAGFTP